jgi:hypothetical protein
MQLDFDETKWPELSAFRKACLANRYDEMQDIASHAHDWYPGENPNDVSMRELALTFQAQYLASTNDLAGLQDLVAQDAWVVNAPWTTQGWLPISQAVSGHGDRKLVEYLVKAGADLDIMVGDPDDRATIADMAKWGGHQELALWLESLAAKGNK